MSKQTGELLEAGIRKSLEETYVLEVRGISCGGKGLVDMYLNGDNDDWGSICPGSLFWKLASFPDPA